MSNKRLLTKSHYIDGQIIPKGSTIISEAFKSGSAEKIVDKMIGVLSRRVGMNIMRGTLGMEYQNNYGSFSGYFCIMDSGAIRINFLLGKSDYVASVDYYDKVSDMPKVTIEFSKTDNIIQIINSVEAVINGESLNESVSIEERTSPSGESFLKWVNEDKSYREKILSDNKISVTYRDYFMDWVVGNGELEISPASFSNYAKAYMAEQGISNPYIRSGIAKVGSKEKPITNKAEEKKFQKELSMSTEEKYLQLRAYMNIVANGGATGFIVSGRSGIGKSTVVGQALADMAMKPTEAKGDVKSVKDLYTYLYKHRDGEIILFDDIDGILKNKSAQNILKAVLDTNMQKDNIVTYLDKDFVEPEDMKRMTARQKANAIPNSFLFDSAVVFITNLPLSKIDKAVLDRGYSVDLQISNEELLANIKNNIEKFPPFLDVKFKLEALEFFEKYASDISTVTYRNFERVAQLASIGHPDWKKWAYSEVA